MGQYTVPSSPARTPKSLPKEAEFDFEREVKSSSQHGNKNEGSAPVSFRSKMLYAYILLQTVTIGAPGYGFFNMPSSWIRKKSLDQFDVADGDPAKQQEEDQFGRLITMIEFSILMMNLAQFAGCAFGDYFGPVGCGVCSSVCVTVGSLILGAAAILCKRAEADSIGLPNEDSMIQFGLCVFQFGAPFQILSAQGYLATQLGKMQNNVTVALINGSYDCSTFFGGYIVCYFLFQIILETQYIFFLYAALGICHFLFVYFVYSCHTKAQEREKERHDAEEGMSLIEPESEDTTSDDKSIGSEEESASYCTKLGEFLRTARYAGMFFFFTIGYAIFVTYMKDQRSVGQQWGGAPEESSSWLKNQNNLLLMASLGIPAALWTGKLFDFIGDAPRLGYVVTLGFIGIALALLCDYVEIGNTSTYYVQHLSYLCITFFRSAFFTFPWVYLPQFFGFSHMSCLFAFMVGTGGVLQYAASKGLFDENNPTFKWSFCLVFFLVAGLGKVAYILTVDGKGKSNEVEEEKTNP